MEIITLVIALFGAVGTLVSWVFALVSNGKHLHIKITDSIYRQDLNQLVLVVSFENRSRLPISITSVFLCMGDEIINPIKYPMKVGSYTNRIGNEVIDRKFKYNIDFPITLQDFGASAGYILFAISQKDFDNFSTHLTIKTHSTRGRVQKIELPCNRIRSIRR